MALDNLRVLYNMSSDLRNKRGELSDRILTFKLLISESDGDTKDVYEHQMASVESELGMVSAQFNEISATIERFIAIRAQYN